LRVLPRRRAAYLFARHVHASVRRLGAAALAGGAEMAARTGWVLGPHAWRWERRAAPIGAEGEELTLEEWSVRAVDVRSRRMVEIECLSGELLVTVEGDLEDHIVSPGESFRVCRRGRVVVAALVPSRLRVREAARAPTAALRRVA
jgi:hypothetical protein